MLLLFLYAKIHNLCKFIKIKWFVDNCHETVNDVSIRYIYIYYDLVFYHNNAFYLTTGLIYIYILVMYTSVINS